MGSCHVLVGLLANEWVLIPLFSSDGEISQVNRLLILGFELILIGLGIATIYFRHLSLTININLLAVSCLFSWGVAEFYLNYKYIYKSVLLAQDETISDDVGDLRAPDGYLHHKMREKVSVMTIWGDEMVMYHTNSLGYRDRTIKDVTLESNASRRILILGDSFTEAVGMEYEESFCGRLDHLFGSGKSSVEILNGGVIGYSPLLEYRTLERFIESGYKADDVVLMYDVSDINDEYIFSTVDWEAHIEETNQALINLWPTDKKPIRPRLYSLIQYHLAKLDRREKVQQKMAAIRAAHVQGSWTEEGLDEFEWGYSGLASAHRNIKKIAELCRQHNIRFTLVIYPWPTQLKGSQRPSIHQTIHAEFARENDLALLDLSQVFYNLDDWESYFLTNDIHWNQRGHMLVAEELYVHLSSTDLPLDFNK